MRLIRPVNRWVLALALAVGIAAVLPGINAQNISGGTVGGTTGIFTTSVSTPQAGGYIFSGVAALTLAADNPSQARTVTFEDPSGADIVVYKAKAQTLTAKTLVAPLFTTTQGFTRTTTDVDGATTFAVVSARVALTCTGAESIATITGGVTGMVLLIEDEDTDCTLVDDDAATAANAIDLTGSANDVGAVGKIVQLYYNGTYWLEVSESDN